MWRSSDPDPRRPVPMGLLGMVALIAAVEGFVARHPLDYSTMGAAKWRHAGQAALREAREAEVLCFGTSLVVHGILPRVIEDRCGKRAYNLAVFDGPITASYYLLKHALEAGARPAVVMLDYQDPPIAHDREREQSEYLWTRLRLWPEILDLRDSLELSWTARDPHIFAALILSRALPSYKARFEIRSCIREALRGRSGRSFFTLAILFRNLRLNRGACVLPNQLAPPDKEYRPALADADARLGEIPESQWMHNRLSEHYARRFLELAARHGSRVLWILPPFNPRYQRGFDRVGLSRYYTRFARAMSDRNPNVVVIDGRSSGFPRSTFWDGIHLTLQGASTLSTEVAALLGPALADTPPTRRWIDLAHYRDIRFDPRPEDLEESRTALRRSWSRH